MRMRCGLMNLESCPVLDMHLMVVLIFTGSKTVEKIQNRVNEVQVSGVNYRNY